MARITTFRWVLDPTPAQEQALVRHAGAARFAWSQCLAMVKAGLDARDAGADAAVPWTPFSPINAFNAWKRSGAAGMCVETGAVGLAWRGQVCAQVFEEAAVDLGRALGAFSASRAGVRRGGRVGLPRFKKRSVVPCAQHRDVRVGEGRPRSVRLPRIGVVGVREDTRARRVLRRGGRILQATATRGASHWHVAVTIHAPDLHPARRHPDRPQRPAGVDVDDDAGRWVGVDRGLTAFAVAASEAGGEVDRITPPRPLAASLRRLRRVSRARGRATPGSARRRKQARRLARVHERVANQRRHFLHETSTRLVKTHDRLVIEDLHVAGLVRNRRLARAIHDAGWADFARLVTYKAGWHGAQVAVTPRRFPSTRRCSACGHTRDHVGLGERTYVCRVCRLRMDRDVNAAVNLAWWARTTTPATQAAVKRTETVNARGGHGAGHHTRGGETDPDEAGTATSAP